MNFSAKATKYFFGLDSSGLTMRGVSLLNPYKNDEVKKIVKSFYDKFYNDQSERLFIIGIDSPLSFNQYDWIVPNTVSSNCLVRISDSTDPLVFDISDTPFTIDIGPQPLWIVQTTPITSSILCVDIVDTVFAWAGTIDGKVLRTTNGGASWSTTSSALGGEVTSIDAINNQRCVVIVNTGSATRIRRTVAGGVGWSTVYEDNSTDAHLNAITMLDDLNGFAIGNPDKWTVGDIKNY